MSQVPRPQQPPRWLSVALPVGFVVGVALEQWARFPDGAWWLELDFAAGLYLLLLIALPVCWWWRHPLRRRAGSGQAGLALLRESRLCRAWLLAVLVGLNSLATSAAVARLPVPGAPDVRFGELPPAYHDEYSYLFQAKTFLAGRLWFPSHPTAARLFDQMHVLNEGRFASRYFPATGAWLAPFVALGQPYWSHWLAGALAAMLIFATGRELAGDGAGLLAGVLTGWAAGMALFSNLLLAHHPTLLGLSLFLLAMTRFQRTFAAGDALLAGSGLTFAALARPMTAAGVGLPFGVWFAWWLMRRHAKSGMPSAISNSRIRAAVAMSAPLLAGCLFLLHYNRELTGSIWKSPYQLYTEIYTPRHMYGFNNRVRGEQHLGPKVVQAYDEWTENLTPKLAARNVRNRLIYGWRWTLGIVPLGMCTAVGIALGVSRTACGSADRAAAAEPNATLPAPLLASTGDPVRVRGDRRWALIVGAIASLHAVHVPYWYDGIMHWHYVFESGPLWLLVFAGVTQRLLRHWRTAGYPLLPAWWCAAAAAPIVLMYVPLGSAWPTPFFRTEVTTVLYSRLRYAVFDYRVAQAVVYRPALVLVDYADPHIDYVTNDPPLDAEVLFGRYLPEEFPPERVARLFPERTIYLARPVPTAQQWEFIEFEQRTRSASKDSGGGPSWVAVRGHGSARTLNSSFQRLSSRALTHHSSNIPNSVTREWNLTGT